MNIRPFKRNDFEQVQQIYQQGIDTGNATFQQQQKSWQQWQQSMVANTTLVITSQDAECEDSKVMGWAGLSAISSREVYAGVAEVSIYVSTQYAGKGCGTQLFSALVTHSETLGYWTLQSAIFPENKASIALHEKHGFRLIGVRERLGKMKGVWRDVWLYERRSQTTGL